MTTKYECNGCGAVMDYDDPRFVKLSNSDREKLADLCPECNVEDDKFIEDLRVRNEDKAASSMSMRRPRK